MAQELVYETYIKRLSYLSLIYSETIIWVLFFICLQQLIEVGAFASISTVFFKTSGVRGRSQTLCFLPIALWAKRGRFFLARCVNLERRDCKTSYRYHLVQVVIRLQCSFYIWISLVLPLFKFCFLTLKTVSNSFLNIIPLFERQIIQTFSFILIVGVNRKA